MIDPQNDFLSVQKLLDQLIQDALHAVRIHLGLDVAFISEFSGGLRIFRYVDSEVGFCPVEVGASDPVEESFCLRVVDGRLPELIPAVSANVEAMKIQAARALRIRSHVSVPIQVNGKTFGTFCCFSQESTRVPDQRDLALVRLYADFVGRLIGRTAGDQRNLPERTARIQRTLDQGLFHLVYQPIHHLGMNRVVGHEALTRFTEKPIQSPDRWFREAEVVGLQSELEKAVIRRALLDFHRFPEDTYLSFNVSPNTVLGDGLSDLFEGYPLDRLMLEVTEHASVIDYGVLGERLAPLRRRGLRLAVDDEGAGYASFRHILKLKPDVIKLDSSLVAEIDKDVGMHALAAALVRFAEQTGSKVVAEGVETEQELLVLRQLNVNQAQGYLLGRPGPVETLTTLRA